MQCAINKVLIFYNDAFNYTAVRFLLRTIAHCTLHIAHYSKPLSQPHSVILSVAVPESKVERLKVDFPEFRRDGRLYHFMPDVCGYIH